MTGLNVRKISNKLLIDNLSQVRKRTFYMQGYFSSYPNDLAICIRIVMYIASSFKGNADGNVCLYRWHLNTTKCSLTTTTLYIYNVIPL